MNFEKRERERESARVQCVYCVCVCVRARARVGVSEREREREGGEREKDRGRRERQITCNRKYQGGTTPVTVWGGNDLECQFYVESNSPFIPREGEGSEGVRCGCCENCEV